MPITRQSYFLPTQITGCSLWLDAADSNTITGTATVTAWTDKSGSGNNAVFDTNKPSYTPANKYIETSNNNTHIRLPSAAFTNTTSQTCILFIIYADKQEGSNNQGLFSTTDFGLYQLLRCPTYGAAYYIRGNMTPDASYTAFRSSLQTTNTVLYSLQYTANVVGADNYAVAPYGNYWHPVSANTQYISSDIYLGGITSFDTAGDIHSNLKVYEVIAYNNVVLTTSQRRQVEAYLAQKWNLTGSLPAGHPGLTSLLYRNLQTTLTKTQYYTAFSPRRIAGCSHWFDATDSSTIILSSGSLTQWNDKSGNGRNLTAVSGFANATVSSAYQNGLNVFNFSGNGLYRTDLGNVSYPLDVFIVVALKSLTNHVDVLGMGDTAVDNFNSLTFAESAASRWHNGSSFGNRQTISTSNETSLSFLLIQWSIANGNYLLRRNGTQLVQASQTYSFSYPASSAFQIGFRHTNINAANFSGYIGEIVVFNNQIGTIDRQSVESYLAQKWGLVSSLPAGHLNATFPAGSPTAIQPYVTSIKPALTNTIRLAIFSYTGSIQTYTVPAGKTSATIYIWGAAGGGDPYGNSGGAGAFITGIMPVTPGTTYYIVVGGGGRGLYDYPALYVNPGGYGGGGTGYYAAGGGGYSGIFSGLTPAQGNTLLLAGGGGGAGPGGYGGSAAWSGTAQAGGGGGVAGSAGQGGTTSAGGAAGTPQTQGVNGTTFPGAALAGGNGCQNYGGAGGGGYWGGGGGTYNNGANGGGGGSSYSNPTYLSSVSGAQSTTGSGSTVAPGNTNPYYVSGVGAAGTSGASGGNGLVVIN